MISRVRLVRFKRFADHSFDLTGGPVLLAGPNNSGKTTLLHAISAWNLALKQWLLERGESAGKKKRISLVLDEFTALPLREMNLLWLNRHTARKLPERKTPGPAPIYVEVEFSRGKLVRETLTIEFLYQSEKQVYVRPVKSPDSPDPVEDLPDFARTINVVHVPAFSGIGTQEPKHASGIQHKLVGEGKPGEIVRNLLLEIWDQSENKKLASPWNDLSADIERLFQCELLPPEFSEGRPYIVCEYRPRPNPADKTGRPPKLDIANAGSGFHQVLMLLSFFYARPASILLLDEPDAHLHFILQREIFDLLRSVAQRRSCQLIIATHAEVLLESAEPDQVISFVGQAPRRLVRPDEKQRLQDALRMLSSLDLIQADHVQAVLYVEDESDHKILREWAQTLGHPAKDFLGYPYLVTMGGKGGLNEARSHFQCLRHAKPGIKGICILDRDAEDVDNRAMPAGLRLERWGRYEIENYLIVPSLLKRWVTDPQEPLLSEAALVENELAANFPAGFDFRQDAATLRDLKGSDFIVALLNKTQKPLDKRDLYMLGQQMTPDEFHPAIREMLDKIAAILPATPPVIEVNLAPPDKNGIDRQE